MYIASAVIGLAFAGLVIVGGPLSAYAACSNPSPLPSGYAAPCPVFSVSPSSISQSQTLALSASPQPGTDYIYTTAYYANGSNWLPVTLIGNNAAPSYSSGLAQGSLTPSILATLTPGTNYIVLWDWLWDAAAQCYQGPGLNQCNTGTWRVQTFGLTQSTSGPAISISPTTLTFPSTQVGVTSAVQLSTLTNTGNAAISFSSPAISGDFAYGNVGTCGSTLAVGASCTYSLVFTPTAAGTRTGILTINDNAPSAPYIITLTGTGSSSYVYSQSAYAMYTYSQSAYTSGCTSGCNNYYVSPTGSDSNSGAQASPWKTITHAASALMLGANGTTVHVAAGTYKENVTTNKSGTASARVVFTSDTQWGAHLVANGCSSWNDTGDYVDVAGFDMTGNCSNGLSMAGNYGRAIGNRIHDLPGTGGFGGILAGNFKTGNQIIGNVIDNIGPYPADSTFIHGIYVTGPSTIVENNIISRAAGWGIHFFHQTTKDVIANNVVINNNHGGIIISAADGATNNNTSVINNIVINNGTTGSQCGIEERFGPTGPNNVYRNNLEIGNVSGNFCFPNGPEAFSGNLCDVVGTGCQTVTSGTQANPANIFVNYTGNARTGDYHLAPGSPAINAGTSGTTNCAVSPGISPCIPTTDFSGTARPQGSAIDIGAYEQ